jgi:hypothetical protein
MRRRRAGIGDFVPAIKNLFEPNTVLGRLMAL